MFDGSMVLRVKDRETVDRAFDPLHGDLCPRAARTGCPWNDIAAVTPSGGASSCEDGVPTIPSLCVQSSQGRAPGEPRDTWEGPRGWRGWADSKPTPAGGGNRPCKPTKVYCPSPAR